ncbi:MAG TPA: hypothetical protein DDZ83_11085 [Nitrospinae bacterium]|nr:hypothetical protein [Nitrospinota bacterium]
MRAKNKNMSSYTIPGPGAPPDDSRNDADEPPEKEPEGGGPKAEDGPGRPFLDDLPDPEKENPGIRKRKGRR